MPDPATHINVTAPAAGGLISSAAAVLFDISPELLLVTFVGCWIGIFRGSSAVDVSRSYWLSFLMVLGIVFASTILAAWSIPILFKLFPEFAQKGVAGITGFCFVYFGKKILDRAGETIDKLFGKI